ncbi:hypothetical protein IscW_ISCW008930 [Ixodes scapularis]|uniref:Uncharacterized protein n=1 Tax=Ixodes scapularis TaxID=6945 RepID=B7Q320_IXOSC|nr:hypothetical protein IscW_ISCW008930 [Ixodes scapularis]|eukprot:XP_002411118.1 hypothetical protein IscW_ISCW008930 [Ixodes scapularis]
MLETVQRLPKLAQFSAFAPESVELPYAEKEGFRATSFAGTLLLLTVLGCFHVLQESAHRPCLRV